MFFLFLMCLQSSVIVLSVLISVRFSSHFQNFGFRITQMFTSPFIFNNSLQQSERSSTIFRFYFDFDFGFRFYFDFDFGVIRSDLFRFMFVYSSLCFVFGSGSTLVSRLRFLYFLFRKCSSTVIMFSVFL